MLRFRGYRTLEAGTVSEGIGPAKRHHPDLILMDIQLPDMDGSTALTQLRGEPTTANILLIALTAQAMGGDRERLLGVGIDGYLTKPISIKEFPDQVRRFCERARPPG